MHDREREARRDDAEPDDRRDRREHPAEDRHRLVEQLLGIEDREAPKERTHHLLEPLGAALLGAALEQLGRVRVDVSEENVRRMQLSEKLDRLILRRRCVRVLLKAEIPDLVDGATTVHQADQVVRRGRKAMVLLVRLILEDVPELAAVVVPVDIGVRANLRPKILHLVPQIAVEPFVHRPILEVNLVCGVTAAVLMATTPRTSGEPNRPRGASRSRSRDVDRSRSC